MTTRRGVLSAALMAATAACGDGGSGQPGLRISFTSARAIPIAAERLEVATFGADDLTELDRRTFDLDGIASFPAEVTLRRGDESPDHVLVVGRLFVGRTVTARGVGDAAFPTDGVEVLPIALDDVANSGSCGGPHVFFDTFGDQVRDPRWVELLTGSPSGYSRETTMGVLLQELSTESANDVAYRTVDAYDLRGADTSIGVAAAPASPSPGKARLAVRSLDGDDGASIQFERGELSFWRESGSGRTEVAPAVPFTMADHTFWRVAATATKLRWETSGDQRGWVTRAEEDAPPWLAAIHAELGIGIDAPSYPAGAVYWNDFNLGETSHVGWCPTVALGDDFEDGAVALPWTPVDSTGCSRLEEGGVIALNLTGSGSCGLASALRYDLTGDGLAVEVPTVPSDADLTLELAAADDSRLRFAGNSAALAFSTDDGGVDVIDTVAYDATAHRFWRIRETSGQIFWEASGDGLRYAVLARTAWSRPVDQMKVRLSLDSTLGTATTASLGSVNHSPR